MKTKSFIAVILLAAVTTPSAQAKILEISKMSKVVQNVNNETLFVLDLDSVVMDVTQMLGSDAWCYTSIDKYIKAGMDKNEAKKKVYTLWEEVQKVSHVEPVEKDTPKLIRSLQDKGIKIIALTSRPPGVIDTTIRQLESIGVDFTRQPIYKKDLNLVHNAIKYYKGIIFKGEFLGSKGDALNLFLDKIKYHPKKVVFVDDRKDNVESVDKALDLRGIDCSCVRFGANDDSYKRYNPAIADIEAEFFGKVLTDGAAKSILKSRRQNH